MAAALFISLPTFTIIIRTITVLTNAFNNILCRSGPIIPPVIDPSLEHVNRHLAIINKGLRDWQQAFPQILCLTMAPLISGLKSTIILLFRESLIT